MARSSYSEEDTKFWGGTVRNNKDPSVLILSRGTVEHLCHSSNNDVLAVHNPTPHCFDSTGHLLR